jgi:hypothetical protein
MWPYWLMFLLPAFGALAQPRVSATTMSVRRAFGLSGPWLLVVLALTLLIGYRFEVGGDWGNYLRNLEMMEYLGLGEALDRGDPGYRLLEWISLKLGWGVYGVNLIGGAIFAFGLAVFCRNLPRPWLALAVAVPYLVTVVGMGYTRQGVAIGVGMLALVALEKRSLRTFVVLVFLAASFHKSAVLLLPIAALAATRNRVWTAVAVAAMTVLGYWLFLDDSVETLYASYIEAEYESQGAKIRLLMNALPSLVLLLWRKRFQMTLDQMRLWQWFAIISLGLLALVFLTPYSTAIDRIALYMLPLQLVVFAYVPEVFGGRRTARNGPFVIAVLAYYAAVLFVWLNYADHSHLWKPYRFYPFEAWL